jgi:hypothetical protein
MSRRIDASVINAIEGARVSETVREEERVAAGVGDETGARLLIL